MDAATEPIGTAAKAWASANWTPTTWYEPTASGPRGTNFVTRDRLSRTAATDVRAYTWDRRGERLETLLQQVTDSGR